MTERPILFQGAMVRAILAGTKIQTRRVMKPQPPEWVKVWNGCDGLQHFFFDRDEDDEGGRHWPDYETGVRCPFGQPGDQLWVRETLKPWSKDADLFAYAADDTKVECDGFNYPVKPCRRYVPSIHLDRCWSRIQLEITAVRVERLQDVSEADASAEGVEQDSDGWRAYLMPTTQCCTSARESYRTLWEQINGPGSWDANPWVWVVEFRRIVL